jgi:arsenate reductase
MSGPVILYGIANCDTIRKAKAWLADREIEYQFHDYRKQGLDPELLKSWVAELGWETLVNRRGTSWRQLAADTREGLDSGSAIQVMLENPALIKRPLLVTNKTLYLGFSDAQYSGIF